MRHGKLTLIPALAAVLAAAPPAQRVIRLSLASGSVEAWLDDGHGWRPAVLDMPLTAGEQIRTDGDAKAEIVFEGGSTLRLGPDASITLATLGPNATQIALSQGTAFLDLRKADGSHFELGVPAASATIEPADSSMEVRADAGTMPLRVEALRGDLHIASPAGGVTLRAPAAAQVEPGARPAAVTRPTNADDAMAHWNTARDEWYSAAFGAGVKPAELAGFVNWYAASAGWTQPPAWGDGELTVTGFADCPWTIAGGANNGWCWTPGRGWAPSSAALFNQMAGAGVPIAAAGVPPGFLWPSLNLRRLAGNPCGNVTPLARLNAASRANRAMLYPGGYPGGLGMQGLGAGALGPFAQLRQAAYSCDFDYGWAPFERYLYSPAYYSSGEIHHGRPPRPPVFGPGPIHGPGEPHPRPAPPRGSPQVAATSGVPSFRPEGFVRNANAPLDAAAHRALTGGATVSLARFSAPASASASAGQRTYAASGISVVNHASSGAGVSTGGAAGSRMSTGGGGGGTVAHAGGGGGGGGGGGHSSAPASGGGAAHGH